MIGVAEGRGGRHKGNDQKIIAVRSSRVSRAPPPPAPLRQFGPVGSTMQPGTVYAEADCWQVRALALEDGGSRARRRRMPASVNILTVD